MSEETAPAPKKKPLIPIVMVLVVLLLGGGFFVMKGKGKDKPKVEIVLAEKDTDVDEFLTNTKNPSVYVRLKMAVRLRKDYEETKFKDGEADMRDAVIFILNGLSPEEITDPKRRKALKKTLAEAINSALEGPIAAPAPEKHEVRRTGKLHKLEEGTDSDSVKPVNDWDSETGPVLKVNFVSLATQ
jgi:flagellar basal body-associated protein FliL